VRPNGAQALDLLAAAQRSGVLLVEGEPGIGKSLLLREVTRTARARLLIGDGRHPRARPDAVPRLSPSKAGVPANSIGFDVSLGRRSRRNMGYSSGEMTMFAVSRGNDGAELRPL
jgi:hypothetical protein